ncbi:MAG: hypothetical protein A2X61_13015 [Ignavibacteria bacterium GWB2_35_12]|nr:MAG: hypothetical protein A2X61_13015 [Ignavibacteria bacterium GWB2_35_12]OGU95051.1 MAG: hypothetical protein A2220_09830 [Ignavibacteria bacterium RIFOXYA2_FULL_35_10]OGV19441.1 MAG: hypothetical protein A2475_05075 [Ignavibacteria bacterium RIFOXYC2_FULL_35_21]
MKTIYYLFLLVIGGNLFAQDIIDPPPLSCVNDTVIQREFNHFIRGFNFYNPGRKLDEAMNMNYCHSLWYGETDLFNNPYNIPTIKNYVIRGRDVDRTINGHALYLEPTLTVDSTENFKPRFGDKSGAVFGFRNRNFDVGDTVSSGVDFSRFKLLKENIGSAPALVLSNIWDGKILHYLDYDGTNDTSDPDNDYNYYQLFNGKKFYFSMNLRALQPDSVINHWNDTILSIRIPYVKAFEDTSYHPSHYTYSNGYVKFDSIPIQSWLGNNDSIFSTINHQFRGKYRKSEEAPLNYDTLFIKGEMLLRDYYPNYDTNSINLSAFILFNGDTVDKNLILKYDWWENHYKIIDYIVQLDVEVTYHGKLDVAIDWFRFETPRARKIFHGKFDSGDRDRAFGDMVDDEIHQTDSCNNVNNRNIKIHRFYASDEFIPSQWAVNRYFNMLVDTLAGVETFDVTNSPPHYYHSTAFKEFWNGSTISYGTGIAIPYIRSSMGNSGCFNYVYGYNGNINRILNDTLESDYETFLVGASQADTILPLEDPLLYERNWPDDSLIYRENVQLASEYTMYQCYYKHPSLLFNKNPWWANIWLATAFWYRDTTNGFNSFTLEGNRPSTGEELRFITHNPILFGAKGILYWKKGSLDMFINDTSKGYLGIQSSQEINFQNSLPSGDSLIYSDTIGGDYINVINDPNRFHLYYDSTKYNFDVMGIDSSRIYIGLKSARAELARFHKWIDVVEDTLMDLKLSAWYGKGYKIFQLQDSAKYGDSSLLSHFIMNDRNQLYDSIFTRKIFSPKYQTWFNPPEKWDSTFLDITLLRHSSDTNMTNLFFIGAQNRRTDPLILVIDTISEETIDTNLKFFSDAEFADSCGMISFSTNTPDTIKWQSYWWKRLGCREIHIPFNYGNTPGEFKGNILHINELGADSYYLDTLLSPFRESKYYHKVDTVITEDGAVNLKMLPGQGKILKVTVSQLINGGQDSSGGKPCTGCEVVNDTAQFKIELISQDRQDSICCWDLYIINKSSCTFTDFPLSFDFDGMSFESLTFTQTEWVDTLQSDPQYNYYYMSGDITPDDTIQVGSICIPHNNTITYEISAGKKFYDTTLSCRVWSGELNCPIWYNDSVCCEHLNIIITDIPDSSSVGCQKLISLSNDFESCNDNYYGLSVYRWPCPGPPEYGEYSIQHSIPLDSVPINLSNYSQIFNFVTCCPHALDCCTCYDFVFLDFRGDTICLKTICSSCEEHSGGGTGDDPDLIGDLISIPPFCCAGLTIINYDTNSTFPDIYHIKMFDPNYPGIMLYSEDRNPLSDPPFDFSPPGMYLTQVCVPEDSSVNINVLLYDADSVLSCTLCYEGSCESEKMNSQLYIGKFEAYPNPANKSVTFDYELLQSAYVKLELYDHMGNIVDKIFSEKQDKGFYKREYYTYELKEGLYYAVLWAENEYKTIGIIIMH